MVDTRNKLLQATAMAPIRHEAFVISSLNYSSSQRPFHRPWSFLFGTFA